MSAPRRLAYLRPATISRWDDGDRDAWARSATAHGIEGVVTKLDGIDARLRDAFERHDLDVLGSFACYSDHSAPGAIGDPVRPVGVDGQPLAPMEWYHGVVPGHDAYDDALVARFDQELRRVRPRTVFLDFLRWPGHWEIESRFPSAPRPASFDTGTLRRFATWVGRESVTAAEILSVWAEQWADFRSSIITDLTHRLAIVAHRHGTELGAFLVPIPHDLRRAHYGQDAAALAPHIEVFAVMTYQQMVDLDIEGTLHLTDEVASITGRDVIAMLQTSTQPEFAGDWDWGPDLDQATTATRAAALDGALRTHRIAGVCCFPGEAPLPSFTRTDLPEGTLR
jgi:hypothetical protein